MNEATRWSSGKRLLLSHALTVLMTLILMFVFFGDRFGLRRVPPLAQIPRGGGAP